MEKEVKQCDVLIKHAYLITMDKQRRIISDAGIAVTGNRIVAVGKSEKIEKRYAGKEVIDCKHSIVHPGLVDSHNHLCFHITKGWEPDTFTIYDTWVKFESLVFPALTSRDQSISTVLAQVEMLKNGTTMFADTGTAYVPDEVMPHRNHVGIRGFMGSHIGDTFVEELAFLDKDVQKALRYIDHQLETYNDGRVKAGVGMSGMGNCSDTLIIEAKKMANQSGRVLHMHQCVYPNEIKKYRRLYNQTPIEHLEKLGVLDENTALVHMIHVTDTDIDLLKKYNTRIVHCPGASLKFSMGAMSVGKYPEMNTAGLSIALGTDASNWADSLDILQQVYLASVVHREVHRGDVSLNAERTLEMATLDGAKAVGMEGEIGAIEEGMLADIVIHSKDIPEARPMFDPVTSLVYSMRSKSVDTVIVDGEIILRNKKVTRFNEEDLYQEAEKATFDLAKRVGYEIQSSWPVL